MTVAWSLGVLPSGVENVIDLDCGAAPTVEAARVAAVEALVAAAMTEGRQEYRLVADGMETIVLPGLTDRGDVESAGLEDAVRRARAPQ